MYADRPRHLVVALHGYAGTGRSMASMLTVCASPEVDVVVAPDGPCAPELAARGRAWYAITSQRTAIGVRARQVAPWVARYIADMRERHGVCRDRTCVVGFSQGAAVAVAALAHDPLCGRAVLVCGRVPSTAEVAPGADYPPTDVIAITGERDRFARHDTVVADLRTSFLAAHARCLMVSGLGHEFNEHVARLAMAHATKDGVSNDQ